MNIISRALSQYGIKEVPGKQNNPEIMKYFSEIGMDWVQGDETAWCSAFVNWVCKKEGKKYSGQLTARSWLDIGGEVDTPELGDVVVLWRESPTSWKGHVGFYVREDDKYIWVLGGNQSNQVNIKPYDKSRLLKYRRV